MARIFQGAVTSFYSAGVAVVDTPFFTIFNKVGSGVLVAVRRAELISDHVSNTGTIRKWKSTRTTTAPTGGTLLTPVAFDTAQTHDADVEIRTRASADGTAAAITATVGADMMNSMLPFRNVTAVGQMERFEQRLSLGLSQDPVILREGQGIVYVQADAGSTSQHFGFSVIIEEFTEATGIDIEPTSVVATATILAPTIARILTIAPDAIVGTATIPVPIVQQILNLTPTPVIATGAIPLPTIARTLTLAPAPVIATAAVPAVAISGVLGIAPAPAAATGAVPPPTVVHVSEITPTPVTATTAIPVPVVSRTLILTPTPVVATAVIPVPSVGETTFIGPPPVSAQALVLDPVITRVLTLTPAPVVGQALIPVPSVAFSVTFVPSPVIATALIPAPTVTLIPPGIEIAPQPVVATAQVPAPTVTGGTQEVEEEEPGGGAFVSPRQFRRNLLIILRPDPVVAYAVVPVPVVTAWAFVPVPTVTLEEEPEVQEAVPAVVAGRVQAHINIERVLLGEGETEDERMLALLLR